MIASLRELRILSTLQHVENQLHTAQAHVSRDFIPICVYNFPFLTALCLPPPCAQIKELEDKLTLAQQDLEHWQKEATEKSSQCDVLHVRTCCL